MSWFPMIVSLMQQPVRKRFYSAILYQYLSICQDRLGTDIGKVGTRRDVSADGSPSSVHTAMEAQLRMFAKHAQQDTGFIYPRWDAHNWEDGE